MTDLKKTIREKAQNHFDYMVQTRRYLHKNPEISFREYDTTEYIVHELKKLGIKSEQPLETGCIGVIEGKKSDRSVAIRADIDALAMDEEGDHKKEFMSERPGAAHCCGHDAHTANLLGVANILMEMQNEIEGKVLLVFQPAEEKLPGGGKVMLDSGILQSHGVQKIFGLHTYPFLEPGKIGTKAGPLMAGTNEFEIDIIGQGGHAAAPHQAVDPIVMAANIISQFQNVVSRTIDPTEPAVVTVGKITGGSAHNVIPEKVSILGTVRTFSDDVTKAIHERMEAIVKGVTESMGGSYRANFQLGYPPVLNDEESTNLLLNTARTLLGEADVREMSRPIMAGEDFAFYQQEIPGTFFYLGSGSEEADSKWSWHHPRYNVDEKCFLTGASLMAGVALGV